MKKLRTLLLSTLGLVLLNLAVMGVSASAINLFPGTVCNGKNPPAGQKTQSTVVCDQQKASHGNPIINDLRITIQILSYIIGVSAIIVIIVAGLNIVTANGNAQAVAKARSMVLYALIGLVIAGISQAIVAFVLNKL